MALLILTNEHEAIKLDHLHGEQILKFDQKIGEVKAKNGGFAQFIFELKRGILDCMRHCTDQPVSLRPKRKPAA